MIKRGIKKLVEKLYAPVLIWYLRKDRYYRKYNMRLLVKKGVFHPAFFFSSGFLLDELKKEQIMGSSLLELGAGSGLISFYAAAKGASVMASDISNAAIQGLHHNAETLGLEVNVVHSDLFDHISPRPFDYIIINPPYYPKDAQHEWEKAWYCGKGFEYFEKLFAGLKHYMQRNTAVWMSLSEDCDVHSIMQIASRNGLDFELRKQKRILWEKNFIYNIRRTA